MCPSNRITGIIHGQRGITADTALRLGHWFGTTPQFWMNLQQLYELRLAESEVGAEIAALPRRCRPVSDHASLEANGMSRRVKEAIETPGRSPEGRTSLPGQAAG